MVDPEPGTYRPRRAILEPDPSEDESVTSDVDGSQRTLAETAGNGSRARRASSRAMPDDAESSDFAVARETRQSYGRADTQSPEIATPDSRPGAQSTSNNDDIGSTGPPPAAAPRHQTRSPAPRRPPITTTSAPTGPPPAAASRHPTTLPAPSRPATTTTSAPTGPPPAAASSPIWTTTTLPHRSIATAALNRRGLRKPRLARPASVPRRPTRPRSTPVGRPGYGRRWRTPPVASGLQTRRRPPSCREPPPGR